jgi:hypothetical protein
MGTTFNEYATRRRPVASRRPVQPDTNTNAYQMQMQVICTNVIPRSVRRTSLPAVPGRSVSARRPQSQAIWQGLDRGLIRGASLIAELFCLESTFRVRIVTFRVDRGADDRFRRAGLAVKRLVREG